ncbi:VOC family protein [Thermomonospora cellulosilytica]|uniref:Catechol 2,3-dioxygenase-like lactoylglutathione lyase family enzyme n=1 Tax=Thermomonospora cellulosilytica TaxID=1411118 RepID=A0A7W3N0L1_9ACTN|nr:VOC family protein [Thermomonospora cellulosilytica]MBA9005343.1 catechol 2,3-dioxygenase-like lactoylglutathione lyase family enzyme [Thermomonospora cellulosilytica]
MNPTMNTIDLVVADMDAAIAFYRRLGLEFKVDPAYPGHAGCDLPNGLHLMLDTEPFRASTMPGWTAPSGSPRSFLCFEFPSPAEVDAKYAELTGAGHRGPREPWDAFWGMRYATVLDPDGNGIDLYAALPAT